MADFIEFVFNSPQDTAKAEPLLPVDYLHLDALTLAYDAGSDAIDAIRERLHEAGIPFSCRESGLSSREVWPA